MLTKKCDFSQYVFQYTSALSFIILINSLYPVNVLSLFCEWTCLQNCISVVSYTDLVCFQHYLDYYQAEEEINAQLNMFAVNMKVAYGGLNDVQTQIGYPSKNGEKALYIRFTSISFQCFSGNSGKKHRVTWQFKKKKIME